MKPSSDGLAISHSMNAINGACAGVGFVQALMFDVRFAAAGAKFTFAFARRGLIAEYGSSWLLPRLVGMSRALDLMMSSRTFTAEEAQELGIVNHVVPKEEVLDAAVAYASDLAQNCSPTSMAVMKQQLYGHALLDVDSALAESNKLMRESLARNDFKEGVKSTIWPGQIFEALGIKYMGPLDGHDLPGLVNMLAEIKHVDSPVLLHVKTVKGQGYEVTASEPTKMASHSARVWQIRTGRMLPVGVSTRQIFCSALSFLASGVAAEVGPRGGNANRAIVAKR